MPTDPLDFLTQSSSSKSSSDPLDFLGENPSRTQSLASAFPKGLIKGAANFSPLPNFGPVSNQLGEKLTEQFLPTQKGRNAEDILEFTGEAAPLALFGEGGLARKGLQAAAGGLAKKGAKELNLPEWAQDLVGGVGMVAPQVAENLVAKGIRSATKQKGIVDFLKSKGLTDQEITPIIQDQK